MKTKTYLIGIIAIIGFAALIQGASAQGAGFNASCGNVSIDSVVITPDDDPGPGVQVQPETVSQCAGVVKCDMVPAPECDCPTCNGYCVFTSNGDYAMAGEGTHCMGPDGLHQCDYTAPAGACQNDTCAYDSDGQWVGDWQGGYAYDQTDGYKMGLKTVNVDVTITVQGGIVQVCNGGHVKIDIDNYDVKGGFIDLMNPSDCISNPAATTATWTGSFKMHYWEKPGEYIVSAHVITCCDNEDSDFATFTYLEKASLCIAPQGKLIDYGSATTCVDNMTEAIGDDISSTCEQCDIGSEPATIRNVGNAVTNPVISATDLVCQTPSCAGARIKVSHVPNQFGVIWVDFGNGPVLLWDTPTTGNMKAQAYCNKTVPDGCCANQTVGIYGLPPGPHATNLISLKIDPLPCVPGGYYTQQITLTGEATESCCQDHRESSEGAGDCITPPQCYELNRYLNLGWTLDKFKSTCV